MLGAGSGAAGAGNFHTYAGESKAEEEFLYRFGLAGLDAVGVVQHFLEGILGDVPAGRVDGLGAEQVGDHPLCAGSDLGGKVGITGGREEPGGRCEHLGVGYYHQRGV